MFDIEKYLGIDIDQLTNKQMSSPKNEEIPVHIDENGEVKERSNLMIVKSRCPILITSSEIDGKIITIYHAYINGPIEDMEGYVPLIDLLNRANENMVFYIHIQSGGGMVTTGATVASAIANCKGHVITIAEGLCASAASLIWSAGHEWEVGDYAMFMYHMSSHADMNNSLYIKENAEKMVNYVKRCLMHNALKNGHITSDECIKFCENKDEVWISAEEMRNRLKEQKLIKG